MELRCDCSNVKISIAEPSQVTQCDCRICQRYRALWAYYRPEDVSISVGGAGLDQWIRGDREIAFLRCAICGCVTHYRSLPNTGEPLLAVNMHMSDEPLDHIPVRFARNR